MAVKVPVPPPPLLPQPIERGEMDDRALLLAAVALAERLRATESDTEEVGVQALIWNLQNLMRLFDRPTVPCPVNDGIVNFTRTVLSGDWETGEWMLTWKVDQNGQ